MEIVQEEYQDEWINLEKEKPVYFFHLYPLPSIFVKKEYSLPI